LIEVSIDLLVTFDRKGIIMDVNGATIQATGMTREELIGTPFADYFTDPEKAYKGAMLAFEVGKVRDYELVMKARDGTETIVLYNASVYRDQAGDVVGAFAAAHDITERKTAEEMIRKSENLLNTVINATREAMISIGQDGLIRIFNPAAEEMFGRKREEMMGKSLDSLMPEEYREQHTVDVNSYFATGEPHNAIGKIVELPALHSDGNVFPMEVSLSVGKYDNKQFVIAVARDITERKAAEEELKETTELLQSILDNATDEVIVTTDRMGIILDWNEGARRLLGYEPEEVVGRKSVRIFHTEEYLKSGIMDVNIKKMIATGKPLIEELSYITKDGGTIPVQEIVSPRFDEDGEFVGMVGMARDITEQKAGEEALKKKNEELNRFNKLAVGRELKMIELKKEINALLEKLGEEPGYEIAGES
jgi:PAS domain S-box-containing protein